jgi:hypothetical protein
MSAWCVGRIAGGAGLQSPPSWSDDDLSKILADVLGYVENNPHRLGYPRERRLGLPIRSVAVESLIVPMGHLVNERDRAVLEGRGSGDFVATAQGVRVRSRSGRA